MSGKRLEVATVFAPATVANVGVGFDILGFAVAGLGDHVTVAKRAESGVEITGIDGIEDSGISLDADKNTAGVPLLKMIEELKLDFGFSLRIAKGIPIGSGLGGSAASAVGAVVAANALLANPLPMAALLRFALEGEAVASGAKHADNVAPCLFGGLTLTGPGDDPVVTQLPYPKSLYCAVVHPAMRLATRDARAALSDTLSLKLHIRQSANLATFIAGCCTGDLALVRRGLDDVLIEPQRAKLIPGFSAVKAAALAAGGLGCSISGAGPTVFVLAETSEIALRAQNAMIAAFREQGGMRARGWISPILTTGATIT
jgi:homoserine kinase